MGKRKALAALLTPVVIALVVAVATPASASPSPTSTTLTSSASPSVSGQLVTFSATVAEVPPGATPTGTVQFVFPGLGNICTGGTDTEPLVSGVAQCPTDSLLAVSSGISVTANYLGDASDAASSGSATQLVNPGPTAVTVTSTAATYNSGQPGHFTAVVAAVSPATGLPKGTITWVITPVSGSPVSCASGQTVRVNATESESCVVPQGQLVAGSAPYTVTAEYSGDGAYNASNGVLSQDVRQSTTKTYIDSSRSPTVHATPVTYSAAVVPSKFGVSPTGTVTFTFTSKPFSQTGCKTVAGSPTINCPGGLDTVGVGYAVSDMTTPADLPGGATVASVGVNFLSFTLTTPSVAASSLTGQTILFTPAATPSVSCAGGSTVVTVASGDALCTVTAGLPLIGSPYAVVASYSGDGNDAASTSRTLTVKLH